MDPGDKGKLVNRLARVGLRSEAEDFRDATRRRLKSEGVVPEAAVSQSWEAMAAEYIPQAEKLEAAGFEEKAAKPEKPEPEGPKYQGFEGDIDDILDSDYTESDQNKRIRDAWLWLGNEFRRITTDTADGSTVQDFARAKRPPPTEFAILLAETYGRMPPERREGMVTKLTSFADKVHTPPTPVSSSAADEYLEGL